LGLLGGPDTAVEVLGSLARLARPGACIIGETLNPHGTTNPEHLRHQEENRRVGRLPGQLRLRIRHGCSSDGVTGTHDVSPGERPAVAACSC